MAHQTGPKKEFIKLTFPRIPTYKQAEEYTASKVHLERAHFRSYEWDKPRHDPFLHLVATRRIFKRTEKFLSDRRQFAKGERIKLNEQWQDLYDKEESLKETFKKMTHFIASNEEKRQRAVLRRQEDYNMRMERCAEIEDLQVKIAEAQLVKEEMDQNIADLKIYERYLNEVVSCTTDFKNADDLLSRYEALVTTRNLLGRRQDANLRALESARLKTSKLAEENAFIILGLNNIVADLRTRYNTATRKALHWETVVYAVKDRMFEKFQEMNEVKQSCWNVYNLMCKRKGDPTKVAENDFERQLLYIKKTLQELEKVKSMALASKTQLLRGRNKSISAVKMPLSTVKT